MNFSKSRLVCVNVAMSWLFEVTMVLNCKVGYMPFLYLGGLGEGGREASGWWKDISVLRSEE